ncbi:hypothetical protein P280DRAFT_404210, partial [Massarina eburnea CBS 473.64]
KGHRLKHLERVPLRSLTFTQVIVFVLYAFAIAYIMSTAIMETGIGLVTETVCYSAVMICWVFYIGNKVTMYCFLVERIHVLRAPYMRRHQDWIWVSGMLINSCGFGTIAILCFKWSRSEISAHDGQCRIGSLSRAVVPLLAFDFFINVLLTGIFVYLLPPVLQRSCISSDTITENNVTRGLRSILCHKSEGSDALPKTKGPIERLTWKSFIACVLVMVPTAANLASSLPLHGLRTGWICFTLCALDGTLSPYSLQVWRDHLDT